MEKKFTQQLSSLTSLFIFPLLFFHFSLELLLLISSYRTWLEMNIYNLFHRVPSLTFLLRFSGKKKLDLREKFQTIKIMILWWNPDEFMWIFHIQARAGWETRVKILYLMKIYHCENCKVWRRCNFKLVQCSTAGSKMKSYLEQLKHTTFITFSWKLEKSIFTRLPSILRSFTRFSIHFKQVNLTAISKQLHNEIFCNRFLLAFSSFKYVLNVLVFIIFNCYQWEIEKCDFNKKKYIFANKNKSQFW